MAVGGVHVPSAHVLEEMLAVLSLFANPGEIEATLKKLQGLVLEAETKTAEAKRQQTEALEAIKLAGSMRVEVEQDRDALAAERKDFAVKQDLLAADIAAMTEQKSALAVAQKAFEVDKQQVQEFAASLVQREAVLSTKEDEVQAIKTHYENKLANLRAIADSGA